MIDKENQNNPWHPNAEVLRRYAKDMDTNTRLIDGDIAPYLRKTAQWLEEYCADRLEFEKEQCCINYSVATDILTIRQKLRTLKDLFKKFNECE